MKILVAEDHMCPTETLLGIDFIKILNQNGMDVTINLCKNVVKIGDCSLSLTDHWSTICTINCDTSHNSLLKNYIFVDKNLELDPFTDYCLKIDNPPIFFTKEKFILIYPFKNKNLSLHVLIGKTVCDKNNIFVRILNLGSNKVKLYEKMKLAKFLEIDDDFTESKINLIRVEGEEIPTLEAANYIAPEVDIYKKLEHKNNPIFIENLSLSDSCLSENTKLKI